jgi:hypothetical protein
MAWKSGDSAWRQLAPPIDDITYLFVTPDAARGGSTLWAVISTGQNTYSVYRY